MFIKKLQTGCGCCDSFGDYIYEYGMGGYATEEAVEIWGVHGGL